MTKLGSQQRGLLRRLVLGRFQIVTCQAAKSLAARGLVEMCGEDGDSFVHITPDGLRALAAEIEAGRVLSGKELLLKKMKKCEQST